MVGISGFGTYVPDQIITGEEIAARSGIPENVVIEKMGIQQKHVCPPDGDHAADMGEKAATRAISAAEIDPDEIDLVLYQGSEFKDYIVWSAAAELAHRIGAENAYANEMYGLCAGTPLALKQVAAQIRSGDIETALLVSASREEDLVDYTDQDASFMFNFGSGASAMIVEADPGEKSLARVYRSAAITDGSFAQDVIMPGGGSIHPPSKDTVEENLHHLTVRDPDDMKERLGPVSLSNFLRVAEESVSKSDYELADLDFVAVTHMKRSFHEELVDELGVGNEGSYYLDEYGHVQSVDQLLALERVIGADQIQPGDLILFLAAGTGYTWAATTLKWQ